LYIFRAKGPDTNENDGSGDPASRTASRMLTEMIQPHTIILNFLRVPQRLPVPSIN
ncbi:hypothetical protein STEG23_020088, partial [Scotinomys teguina]